MTSDTSLKALKAFKSKKEGELSFKKGQIITIIGRNDEKGLLQGEFQGKKGLKTGWFPSSYVKALSEKDLDELKKEEEKRKKEEDKKREKLEHAKEKERKKLQASDTPKKRPDKLAKYSKESKFLTAKIANRPSKESLIERGILKADGSVRDSNTLKRKTLAGFLTSRPSKEQLGKIYDGEAMNSKQIFGVPLGQIMFTSYTEFKIPDMVSQLITYLLQTGLKEQGLFRVSGSLSEINELKDLFNRGETPDLSKFPIHAISSTLKLFFRQLPEPLFTFDLFDAFLKASAEVKEREPRIERFQSLLKQLPHINFVLLAKLMIFLNRVSSHSEENKMSASNLGIVFGPTLLWPKDTNPMFDMMSNTSTSDIVSLLIDEYQTFFKDYINDETTFSLAKKPSSIGLVAEPPKLVPELSQPQLPKPPEVPQLPKPLPEVPQLPKPILEAPQFPKPILETPQLPKPIPEAPQLPKPILEAPQLPKPILEVPQLPKPTPEASPPPKPTAEVAQSPQPESRGNGTMVKAEEPLPPEWEQAMDSKGRSFFIDHKNKRTQWEDPRLKRGPSLTAHRAPPGLMESTTGLPGDPNVTK